MSSYQVNKKCIIGMPSCGYGFESSRPCFLARPDDGEFQFEEDILASILKDKSYEIVVALRNIDPGNFAFCTKICSKIITSQFCIVLLNNSIHAQKADIKIPNPNVHFEYGMMLSFFKHVIPMQREDESLPFNVYPIDTIKYKPINFKTKAEEAIDDAILRFKTKEPAGRPIGSDSNILKYFAFKGLQFTDMSDPNAKAIFSIGQNQGFNLFDGTDELVFFGSFHNIDPKEIVIRIKLLLQNIKSRYERLKKQGESEQVIEAKKVLDKIKVEVLVPESSAIKSIKSKAEEFTKEILNINVNILKLSNVENIVKEEYDNIKF